MSKIAIKQLAKYAVDRLDAGDEWRQLSTDLASFLVTERRTKELDELIRLISDERAKRGLIDVKIISTRPVEKELKQRLASLLKLDGKPLFQEDIDPTLVGGVIARTNHEIVDLSVRTKLNKMISGDK
jgi:F0F1-type ATP synthase delta subunit